MPLATHKIKGRRGLYEVTRYLQSDAPVAVRLAKVSKRYRLYGSNRDTFLSLLSRRFRRSLATTYALKEISFELKKGENIVIVGTHQSGKSSLLQIIVGSVLPTSGSVETHGKILLVRPTVSDFDPNLTPRKNLEFRARILGLDKHEAKKTVEKALAFADIDEYQDKPFRYTPKLLRNRLSWAFYLTIECDILLLDGMPPAGLGKPFRHICNVRLFEMLTDPAINIVVATRKPLLRFPFNQSIALVEGQMAFKGTPEDVVSYLKEDKEKA